MEKERERETERTQIEYRKRNVRNEALAGNQLTIAEIGI
jgi:hypothetical protein